MNDLAILRMADALARHATGRHELVSRNIANADTPGYRARDLTPFTEVMAQMSDEGLRATRPGHLAGTMTRALEPVFDSAFGAESPNGNDVAIDDQMARAARAMGDQNRAVTVYGKTLDILRASLGR
jgi:flagellar basal-body rod protein FlgB